MAGPSLVHGQAAPKKASPPAKAPAGSTAPKFKAIWEPVNYNQDLQLTDVHFVSRDVGWVTGAAGTILGTTDGGKTWTAQLGGDPAATGEQTIGDLRFVSDKVGWATQVTGAHTNLLRTFDGESWAQQGTIAAHYKDYAFTSESDGVYASGDKIFKTSDGGKTWTKSYDCQIRAEVQGLAREMKCQIFNMSFPSAQTGYAFAYISIDTSAVLKSEDGGATWSLAHLLEKEYANDGGLHFTDENNGFVRTYNARVYATSDGGKTWNGIIANNLGLRFRFADPQVGWSILYKQISYTADGGRKWTSRTLTFPAAVTSFALPQRDRGYVVGAHGMVYRYRIVPITEVVPKAIDAPAMPATPN